MKKRKTNIEDLPVVAKDSTPRAWNKKSSFSEGLVLVSLINKISNLPSKSNLFYFTRSYKTLGFPQLYAGNSLVLYTPHVQEEEL